MCLTAKKTWWKEKKLMDRQIDGQTDRQADRQSDRLTDRLLTDIEVWGKKQDTFKR